MRMTKMAGLTVAAFGLSLVLAGCGGPDNEKAADLTTDGKAIPVTGTPPAGGPKDSNAAYDSTRQNLQQTKGYPKKK